MKKDSIKSVRHLKENIIEIVFIDGKQQVIDFSEYFAKHPHPQYSKYENPELFSKFSCELYFLAWGADWDLMFKYSDLYKGKIC